MFYSIEEGFQMENQYFIVTRNMLVGAFSKNFAKLWEYFSNNIFSDKKRADLIKQGLKIKLIKSEV